MYEKMAITMMLASEKKVSGIQAMYGNMAALKGGFEAL